MSWGGKSWSRSATRPPPTPASAAFLALDTATPYVAAYEGKDANKTAHYMLRWATRAGDKGPWSETVSATIGG